MHSLLVSHPTGNANVREMLKSLNSIHALTAFYTTLGFSENSWYAHTPFKKYIQRRLFPVNNQQLHTCPLAEIFRLMNRRLFPNHNIAHKREIDHLYRNQDKYVAKHLHKHALTGIYAYEDGALATFQVAKKKNLTTFYELPIAYWKTAHELLKEESVRYPAWEKTLIATQDESEKCRRKDDELNLADYIICPSDFVKNTLPTHIKETKPCVVLPYGAPLPQLKNVSKSKLTQKPLKLLFAGSLTQRKGLADVFAALKMLNPHIAQLSIVGTPILPLQFYKQQFSHFKYFPSMPQSELFKLMSEHDLLVLPSIIEGRALVQLEALGCGLPILITPNTGGNDLIQDNHNGYLVPIRSPEIIAEKIQYLYDHPEKVLDLKKNAYETAQNHQWINYRQQVINFFHQIL